MEDITQIVDGAWISETGALALRLVLGYAGSRYCTGGEFVGVFTAVKKNKVLGFLKGDSVVRGLICDVIF